MFAGRYRLIALACLVSLAAGPLRAEEPANEKIEQAAPLAEAACPDELPLAADDADDPEKVRYCLEPERQEPSVAAEYGITFRLVRRLTKADDEVSSRRRQTHETQPYSSQRVPRVVRTAGDPAVHPVERLRAWHTADVEPQKVLVADRSMPADVMRRWLGLGESCPLCGKPHAAEGDDRAARLQPPTDQPTLGYTGLTNQTATAPSPHSLRTGEPAQIILDTQKRLGKSVLEGTEFDGSPELLIQWIRALDEENRRRQAAQTPRFESMPVAVEEDLPVTSHSQIAALREACRNLQEAADLLEDQNLFESADALRASADGLRRQARDKIGESEQAAGEGE